MNVDIIVPSNNVDNINKFIKSYMSLNLATRKNFRLKVVLNNIKDDRRIYCINEVDWIWYNDEFDIVPFLALRWKAMEDSDADFFLFLDDDHTFEEGSDRLLNNCLNFLHNHKECGLLQLEKANILKGFHVKKNAHVWTSRGLFIKNIGFNFGNFLNLVGAGEDLFVGYTALVKGYIPYCHYNSTIKRNPPYTDNRYQELNNPSYSEDLLDKNIVGFIRQIYDDPDWRFYGSLENLKYPNKLKEIIQKTLTELI